MAKNKRLYLTALAVFCIINLFEFLLHFIPNYVLEIDIGYAEYGRIFINKLIEFSIPALAAAVIFAPRGNGWKTAIVDAAGISGARLIYLLPYYYLYFIDPAKVNYSYDSIEAVGLSLAVSLFGALLLLLQMILFYAIMRFASRICARKAIIGELPQKKQVDISREEMAKIDLQADGIVAELEKIDKPFDLSSPLTLGLFCSAFCQFIINFILEFVSSVQYFISVSGSYRFGEIIYMMICYLFILLEMLTVHTIGCKIVNKAREESHS